MRSPYSTFAAAMMCVLGFACSVAAEAPAFRRLDCPSDAGARGIVSADFDRNGWPDLAQANTGRNSVSILLNREAVLTRVFELPVGAGPFDLATADFNRDGIADLAVANADGHSVSILIGKGDGQFTRSDIAMSVYTGLNRDARLDLVCMGAVLLGAGDGLFGPPISFMVSARALQVADINRDGKPDVVTTNGEIYLGDGTGRLRLDATISTYGYARLQIADLNRDGYPDLVFGDGWDSISLFLGGPTGYRSEPDAQHNFGFESHFDLVIADVNLDGIPDIVANVGACCSEAAGVGWILQLNGDGSFRTAEGFALPPGEVLVADVSGDGLPDLVSYDARALHVLVNRRNDVNHAPLVPAYARTLTLTGGAACVQLEANAFDPDQHALMLEWVDETGARVGGGMGRFTYLDACFEQPGIYRYRRTASDGRGGSATGTVTVTVVAASSASEIVLRTADAATVLAGSWERVADPSAAGGLRAHDRNASAPKVTAPSPSPTNYISLRFAPDPALAYKLWIRLKADGNSWANDSVWVQFSGSATADGTGQYRIGTTSGLAVSLEECVNCGVSGWGWEDDGWGAADRNGALLRFPDGGVQTILIATREDGVSVDQVVLSSEKYLSARPGLAKNDATILPLTLAAR